MHGLRLIESSSIHAFPKFSAIAKLTQLTGLIIHCQQFQRPLGSSMVELEIPCSITALRKLQHLQVQELPWRCLLHVTPELPSLSNLTFLALERADDLTTSVIARMPSLSILSLSNQNLHSLSLLEQLSSLHTLKLQSIKFGQTLRDVMQVLQVALPA